MRQEQDMCRTVSMRMLFLHAHTPCNCPVKTERRASLSVKFKSWGSLNAPHFLIHSRPCITKISSNEVSYDRLQQKGTDVNYLKLMISSV